MLSAEILINRIKKREARKMSDIIRKAIPFEVKEVAERTLEFVGSTEEIDRDGEVINVSGWQLTNYRKNPVFMWAHRYDQPPIGKATSVTKRDGQLKFKIQFADKETYEFADTIFKLYKGGFLKATSVGFIPIDWEDGDGEKTPKRRYSKQELLELSAVPVPSLPSALITEEQAQENEIDMGVLVKAWDEVTKPEETDDWIRIPIAECDVTATIDISKKEGIKALYCGKEKKIKTYMFDKRPPYNWTMERAKLWVEDHKSYIFLPDDSGEATPILDLTEDHERQESVEVELEDIVTLPDTITGAISNLGAGNIYYEPVPPAPKNAPPSQSEIKDEIDFVIDMIAFNPLAEETKQVAWDIVRSVMRVSGDDMPVDILEKVGAVLSAKNKQSLKEAQNLIQSVLDGAEPEPERESNEPTEEQIAEAVAKSVIEKIKQIMQ